MRNCKVLMKMLVGFLALSGMVGAATSTLSLSVPVTPDINDKASRWEYRLTTTYDVINNRYFAGAVAGGAGEYAISMFETADSGATITKTGLTPANIYAVPASGATVSNPLYNAKVWDMDCFVQGANTYVAAIMQLAGDAGVGGSVVAVINVANPAETYISAGAMSLENEAAGTANTASKFVKLTVGHQGATPATRIVFAAVADPVTGEFDTSKGTVGLRAFSIPSSPADYSLPEVDMLTGTGKGVLLGNTAAMMSAKMRKLTSMAFDSFNKVLYLGGYMSDDTLGISGFYLTGSNVLTSLNNSTGGTLLNSTTPTGFAELSRIHRLRVQNNGTNSHLIVNAGSSSKEQTGFYTLSLMTGSAGTVGKLAQGNTNSVATARSQLWIANGTSGVYSSAAKAVLGNAPFPLSQGAVLTRMNVVGNSVYVSTWNAVTGSEVWVTTATLSSNYVNTWTSWQRLANTSLRKVTGFGTDATNLWAVLDRSSVYVNSAVGSVSAVIQPSLGLANIKDKSARTRLRKIAIFDAVNRQLVTAAPVVPDHSTMSASHNLNLATGVNAVSNEVAAGSSPLASKAIWDMAISSTGDRYYLLNTIVDGAFSGVTGGQVIVKVPADGSAVTSISSTGFSVAGYTGNTTRVAFFKDGNGTPAVSRCIKIVPGTNPSTGLPVLFCFIPDAADADTNYFMGDSSYDLVKVLNSDLTDPGISCTYKSVIDGTTGHHMSGNIDGLQSAFWDATLARLYLGGRKASGNDPALSMLSLDSGSLTGTASFASGRGSNNSIQDVYQLATMHLSTDITTTQRSILLVAGTLTGDATSDRSGYISALPLMRYGASKGNIATINPLNPAVDYTITATTTDLTWSMSTRSDLFMVGGAVPWNIQAAVVDMKVADKTLFVTVANAPGIVGQAGVFATTAVTDSTGSLAGWTPWVAVSGLSASMQNVIIDAVSGQVIGLDLASGQPAISSWKMPGTASSFDQLANALNTDFADNGGVNNLSSHTMVEGIVYNNNVGTGASANLIVATGNQRVAIGHVQYKTAAGTNTQYNPDSANVYGYKNYTNDTALNAIGNIYCSTVSRGTAGWVLVGGENGIGVLRVPGARAGSSHSGEGWTGSVPKDLMDLTSTGSALSNMTWYKLPGVTGPVYGMTTVYDKTGHVESVVAIGKGGVYAFTLAAAKFADITPADLGLTTLSVLSAASGAAERMWCVEPVYRGMGVCAVGTTLGMYLAQYDAAAGSPLARLAEVLDANSASLGPVASIASTRPIFTASTNPRYTLDCVTANARTDVSKHYRLSLSFAFGTGAIVETAPYLAASVKTLDRMTTQIINDASVNTYVAGVPNRLPCSVSVLSKTIESSTNPVSGGLSTSGSLSMSGVATVGADGSKLVAVGGRVYVKST